MYIDGTPYVSSIQATGTEDTPSFLVTGTNEQTKEQQLFRIKEIFQWQTPLHGIHEHFLGTALQPIFDIHRGTAILLDYELFGNLVKGIIH